MSKKATKNTTTHDVGILVICITLVAVLVFVLVWWWKKHRVNEMKGIVSRQSLNGPGHTIFYYRIRDALKYDLPSLAISSAFIDACETETTHLGHKYTLEKAKTYESATLVLFETLNFVQDNLDRLRASPSMKFVFGVPGTDYMASKSALVTVCRKTFGVDITNTFLPKSYVVGNPQDIEAFTRDAYIAKAHDPNTLYIMKKNVQRQQGCVITNDIMKIMKNYQEYVVIQELLQDPLLIDGRKVNMRVYLLVECTLNGEVNFHVCKDGFMYYTAKPFIAGSLEPERHITTGYIDRHVYEINPLTHRDLANYLGPFQYTAIRDDILRITGLLKRAYVPIIQKNMRQDLKGVCYFSIFGMDIAPSRDLTCKLMEINKGPDLSYKDARDRQVKMNMVANALRVTGVLENRQQSLQSDFEMIL